MNNKKILYKWASVLLTIATGLSGAVNAEELSQDSVNTGLTTVQKAVDSTRQTTEAVQTGANAVAGIKSSVMQGSLTDTLVKKLGITSEQAQGGAGALFQLAKGKLDAGQFAELSKAVPEMNSLLNAVPKQSGALSGLAGSVSSALGDSSNTYGNLAGLASTFKTLNLSPDMVDEFVPVVVDYVRTKGGALTADMLQSAIYGDL
ncbi:MAG: DUF2780 domain-containing protein [Methylococcaceae bacterium]|jgi:hypothetical protein|nr:DUF2780 domain-containing protein [Methylococcaceae bacterium]OYV20151.1 MAG: hypothetical protein CG441_506 [Methylococcaceae bacterium NSM2-1]